MDSSTHSPTPTADPAAYRRLTRNVWTAGIACSIHFAGLTWVAYRQPLAMTYFGVPDVLIAVLTLLVQCTILRRRVRRRATAAVALAGSQDSHSHSLSSRSSTEARNSFSSFPRLWALLQYLLPKDLRIRLFTPAHEDLKADYYESYKQFRSKSARRWLRFCFALRTIILLCGCLWTWGLDKLLKWLSTLLPSRLRQWWTIQ